MAEVRRTNGSTSPNSGSNEEPPVAESTHQELPSLPASETPASNPTWNRSAEAVGRGVGTAVSEVRRLPRRLDDLKSRIHLVGKDVSTLVHDLGNSAEDKAAELHDAAEVGLLEFADKAAVYTSDIGSRAGNRIENLRREAWWKLEAVRTIARHRVANLRRWTTERPLQVIMVSASAAFAVGVLLRIWRSNRD